MCKKILFIILLNLAFLGCFEKKFDAINADKPYIFEFDGFKKSLNYGKTEPYALIFFTKDCGACKEQIATLNKVQQIHAFSLIAVLNDAANRADAEAWADKYGLKAPLIYEPRAADFLSRAVGGIYGVPVLVFFDKMGTQKASFLGLTPQSVIEREILSLK